MALRPATSTGRTVYDCLNLALALRTKSVLFTLDGRLAQALADGPLAAHVARLGANK